MEPEHAIRAAILSDIDAELIALEARCDKTRALKQGMMEELCPAGPAWSDRRNRFSKLLQ